MPEQSESIMTPVGRIVAGSIHEPQKQVDPQTKQPKLDQAGQQIMEYFFALAIPKDGSGNHWAHTEWGAVLWAVGHMAFPGGQAQSRPDFAWKVVDGDSPIPNQNNIAPNTREGYLGHWVLSFKTGFAPQMVNADGKQAIAGSEFYRGCYAQVLCTVRGNASNQSPGIYLNHQIVALSGHGERIITGPDAATAGFGQAPAPQAMSQVPVAQNVAANVPMQPVQPMAPAPQPQPGTVMAAPGQQQVVAPDQPHPQVMTPPPPVQR